MKIRELREQRAKLLADQRAVVDKAEAENRNPTDDEKSQIRKMETDFAGLGERIARLEQLEAEERALRAEVPETQRVVSPVTTTDIITPDQALLSYFRNGEQGLRPEERAVLRKAESREMNLSTGAYVVEPNTSFYSRLISATKFFGGMFNAGCTEIVTETGADLPIPTNDDTANVGAIVAEEGSHASGTALTLAQVTLHAYLYSTKIVKVSWQLLQDSAIDFPSLLASKFGERLGRIQNTHLTTGTGTGQPQGVVTAATSGVAGATGTTTSIPADNLFELFHSVDISYRPNARWMMNDDTALILRKLKDGNGQYLWQPGLQASAPDVLLGKPVVVNNDMATKTASAKTVLFGDFSSYYIRRVRAISVVRLNELYAANGQVGFMAFMRFDGAQVDAGQHPIKYFAHSAS